MSKIRDVICKTYTYVCIWKISIFSNANVTDALSSNNGVGCKWGEGGGGKERAVYFHIPRKISGKVLYGNMYV